MRLLTKSFIPGGLAMNEFTPVIKDPYCISCLSGMTNTFPPRSPNTIIFGLDSKFEFSEAFKMFTDRDLAWVIYHRNSYEIFDKVYDITEYIDSSEPMILLGVIHQLIKRGEWYDRYRSKIRESIDNLIINSLDKIDWDEFLDNPVGFEFNIVFGNIPFEYSDSMLTPILNDLLSRQLPDYFWYVVYSRNLCPIEDIIIHLDLIETEILFSWFKADKNVQGIIDYIKRHPLEDCSPWIKELQISTSKSKSWVETLIDYFN